MKNVQVIEAARNCTYSLFAVTDRDFAVLFPEGEDVAFSDEVQARVDPGLLCTLLKRVWSRPVVKARANGIHGTLLYDLDHQKETWPTRREAEVQPAAVNAAQRALFRRIARRR